MKVCASCMDLCMEDKGLVAQECCSTLYECRAGFPDFAKLMCNYSLPLTTSTPSSHASDVSTAAFVAIAVAVICLLLLCLVMLLKSVRGTPRTRPPISDNNQESGCKNPVQVADCTIIDTEPDGVSVDLPLLFA